MMQLLPTLGMGGSVVFFFMSPQPFMRIMGMVMIASTVAMTIATKTATHATRHGQPFLTSSERARAARVVRVPGLLMDAA